MFIKTGYEFSEEELEMVYQALRAQALRYKRLASDANDTCDEKVSQSFRAKASQFENLAARLANHGADGI
jgi:hypothetical protein